MDKLHIKDKKVLVRVDFNVPIQDGIISDDTRMQKALPTLQYLLKEGAALIICSHLGRPQKKKREDGTIDVDKYTLRPVAKHLANLLAQPVHFASDTIGTEAKRKSATLQPGEVLLLENTRFEAGETKGDVEMARTLADLADIYINDAFGTAHRAHASTSVVAECFADDAKAAGFLMDMEIKNANKVLNSPQRPVIAITGGAKVSDKLLLLEKLIEFADTVIVGGGMAYTFFKAQGGTVGDSICEHDKLDLASALIAKAEEYGTDLLLPIDNVIADRFAADASSKICPSLEIPDGWMGLDIGPETVQIYRDAILSAKTIIWNGPMGVFEMEAFAHGTTAIAKAVAEATGQGAFSLIGGGDSVAAIRKNKLDDDVSFVSTGGGAMLEYLEGKTLPGVAAIMS